MPNIAAVLKSEISRIARKEGRSEIESLRKTVTSQCSDIATLRKKLLELEKVVKALAKTSARETRVASKAAPESDGSPLRFRAAGMAANRKRLGLSARDFGLLVGATGQAVYNWEAAKSKPTHHHLEAIALLRGIGKREVAERLASLKPAQVGLLELPA